MLPKKSRISRELFSKLLLDSKYINFPTFSLRYLNNSEIKETRIGVSVSKKVSKSAVVRNTVRRRVYTTTSSLFKNFPSGFFLFVAKPGAEKLKGEKLKEEIKKLLDKVSFVSISKKS